ncbi:hypothetical protein H8959_016061 [Pygathrix nigripes]
MSLGEQAHGDPVLSFWLREGCRTTSALRLCQGPLGNAMVQLLFSLDLLQHFVQTFSEALTRLPMENSANVNSSMGDLPTTIKTSPIQFLFLKSTLQDKDYDHHLHSFSLLLLNYVNGNDSANKVHDNKVQDGAGKEKISKGSLWGDALEVRFVLIYSRYASSNFRRCGVELKYSSKNREMTDTTDADITAHKVLRSARPKLLEDPSTTPDVLFAHAHRRDLTPPPPRPQGWLSGWLPTWRPTSMSQLKNVEARILQCLQNKFLARYVSLPNQNKIWTVTVSPEQKDRTPLVMVHGFGGGVGLWILNMDSLSARRTLHTFDLLGFGRSSRPAFPRDPEGAEDEFVTSIETWRETMGIPSMILLGHSLGGFLATSYSIKYPERVKHLILVDPWGFPLRPTNPSEIRAPPTWVKAVASVLGRSNPLAVLRVAGPWGPGLVQRFRPDFKRKFADFFEDDTISEYIYHCNAQNPSGETAFKAMMESFGWARRPMLERIHLIRKDVPITMIYGSNTWIDTSTGKKVKMQRPDSYVRDMEIEGASHHVYADQPHIFNAVVEEICDSVD